MSKVADEQLFYLMSRGLSEEQAMGMIVNGFIEPVTRTLPMEYAVEWSRLIELQMEGSRSAERSAGAGSPIGSAALLRLAAPRGRMARADAPGLQVLREPHLPATARPCGSATSTSRPRRRGAARTTAPSSSAGWPT